MDTSKLKLERQAQELEAQAELQSSGMEAMWLLAKASKLREQALIIEDGEIEL